METKKRFIQFQRWAKLVESIISYFEKVRLVQWSNHRPDELEVFCETLPVISIAKIDVFLVYDLLRPRN